jgi:hypothetical protein
MKRIVLMATVALVMAAMMAASALPAFAEGLGPSACQEEEPGQYVSFVAQEVGHSGENNPGNALNEYPPFVPAIFAGG